MTGLPESVENFSDIQDVFTIFNTRERRRIQGIDNTSNTLSNNQHNILKMHTTELKSKIDLDLFNTALESWTNTIARTFPSPQTSKELNQFYQIAKNPEKDTFSLESIQFSLVPNPALDILASLVPFHDEKSDLSYLHSSSTSDSQIQSWSDFSQFWEPVMNSPLCLLLLPQLLCRVSQIYSPYTGAALFYYVNRGEVQEKLRYSRQISTMYQRSVNCGLNALIGFLTPVPRAQNQRQGAITSPQQLIKGPQDMANINLIYDLIEQTELEPPILSIFSQNIQKIFPEVPKHHLKDFYALLISKNLRLDRRHYNYLIDQLLINGTDAEKSLVMNTDNYLHRVEKEKEKEKGESSENESFIRPAFNLQTYSQILKTANKMKNEALATFIKDKVLVNYIVKDPSKLQDVAQTVLRSLVDSGNIQDIAAMYEYLSKLPGFKPTVDTYASLFRGFRKASTTILESESRCFEILNIIHSNGWDIPLTLCTEILSLIKEKYHMSIFYEYYQSYFGLNHLIENNLGIDSYFEEISVPPGLPRPPHEASISPESSINPTFQYDFNSVAFCLLYETILSNVEHIQQLQFLYIKFRESQYYNDPSVYISVIDNFVRALTTRFQTPEAVNFARAIVEDLVFNNASFKRFDSALTRESFGENPPPPQEVSSSNTTIVKTASGESILLNGTPPAKTNMPSKLPTRYAGLRLQCFGLLINQYCETDNIEAAKEVLKLSCLYSPIVHGKYFEPIIEYYILKNNIEMARTWYDGATKLGAYITNKVLLDALEIDQKNENSDF
ncbi:uncharacterized protein SAPINGB_P002272 [Magnusiomyces paraingens]|uniref:Uncharacterized protein n=1 Tax=Magnusiomyces paraingens TaxID=2606893 RepID=A0A5E8BIP3_9ASCO|nr:uncharacterized protein SAPINGB_P002272 [Saprochaete ingens]VVT49443.1 unnamed protein product [Saprochaete ingens]